MTRALCLRKDPGVGLLRALSDLKEQYRVAVEVADLTNDGQGCNLGRTGQVIFANQNPSPITAAAH